MIDNGPYLGDRIMQAFTAGMMWLCWLTFFAGIGWLIGAVAIGLPLSPP